MQAVGGGEGGVHTLATPPHPDPPEEHEHGRPDHVLLWRLAVPAEGQEDAGVRDVCRHRWGGDDGVDVLHRLSEDQ